MTLYMNMLSDQVLTSAFGAAGLICQLTWPVFSKRRSILSVQMGIGSNYGIQYALLGAWSGAGVCALGATQTLIALIAGDRPWLKYLGLAFIPLVILISVLTWNGVSSLMAMSACCLIMIGRMQNDTLRMRIIMLCASPFGIGYDLSVGAVPALVGGLISAAIAANALYREWQERHCSIGWLSQPA